MNALFAWTALSGFFLALAAHIAAICGVDVAGRYPFIWGLHFGIFIVLIPVYFSMKSTFGAKPALIQLRNEFPRWVLVLGVCMMAYTLINFLLFIFNSEGGTPTLKHGKYVLLNHGTLIREISESEYRQFMANIARGFSGHWLFFYFFSFAWFKLRKNPDSCQATPDIAARKR